MDILIKPLDMHTLEHAIVLRDKVFPNLSKSDHVTLTASLYPEQYHLHRKLGIQTLEYWVAVTDERIIGLIGLYAEVEEKEDSIWLGWYCVDPQCRGQKIGSKLLEFAINEVKNRNKKYLHLYTTADDEYATARSQYKKIGFEHYKSVEKNVFYRLTLNDQFYCNIFLRRELLLGQKLSTNVDKLL